MILKLYKKGIDESQELLVYFENNQDRVLERYFHRAPNEKDLILKYWNHLSKAVNIPKPLYHIILSWEPGQQAPGIKEVTCQTLKALGLPNAPTVAVRHCDRPHDHFHLVLCRIDPENFSVKNLEPEDLRQLREEIQRILQPQLTEDELLKNLQKYYSQKLEKDPKAISYLKSRGIDLKTALSLEVGYAPKKVQPPNKPNLRTSLLKLGLLKESKKKPGSYYYLMRNRIVFPVKNLEGKLLGFVGRTLDPNENIRYLNQPGLQKKLAFVGVPKGKLPELVYLVEGPFDVLALHQIGKTALSLLGKTLSKEQAEALAKAGVKKVVMAFDNDTAGKEGENEAAYWLQKFGIKTYRIKLPKSVKDVSECLQQQGPTILEEIVHRLEEVRVKSKVKRKFKELERLKTSTSRTTSAVRFPVGRSLDEISLTEVASIYTQLSPTSSGFRGLCPAHREKTPSFYVDNNKGFYCFGCGIKGRSPLSLIMQVERVSKQEALSILQERLGLALDKPYKPEHTQKAMMEAKSEKSQNTNVILSFKPSTEVFAIPLLQDRSSQTLEQLFLFLEKEYKKNLKNQIQMLYSKSSLLDVLLHIEKEEKQVPQPHRIRLASLFVDQELERSCIYEITKKIEKDGYFKEFYQFVISKEGEHFHKLLKHSKKLMQQELEQLQTYRLVLFQEVQNIIQKHTSKAQELTLLKKYQIDKICKSAFYWHPKAPQVPKPLEHLPEKARQEISEYLKGSNYNILERNIRHVQSSLKKVEKALEHFEKMKTLVRQKWTMPLKEATVKATELMERLKPEVMRMLKFSRYYLERSSIF